MTYISTNVQKKIMYIPFVNITNFFVAVHNCGKAQNPGKMKLRCFGFALCSLIPFTFLCSILSRLFPVLEDFFFLFAIYTGPLIMSYGLIRIQEKKFTL